MLDLMIDGGTVVDGTGAPRRRADVGMRDGRIVAIGRRRRDAARTIDADGLVVAPGFVDVHTHYDAQVFWDPTLSRRRCTASPPWSAATAASRIAPLAADEADYLMRMLARVEGMPLEALERACRGTGELRRLPRPARRHARA